MDLVPDSRMLGWLMEHNGVKLPFSFMYPFFLWDKCLCAAVCRVLCLELGR